MANYAGAMHFVRQYQPTPSGEDLSKMSKIAHRGWELFFYGILGIFVSLCCLAINIIGFLILLSISFILLLISAIFLLIDKKRKSKIVASKK